MSSESELYRRRPGISWREEREAAEDVLAALEAGEESGEEGTLIIVVSGQIFELNLLGAEIWKLCDGEHSVGQIVDELHGRFEVSREDLEGDVREFLEDMVRREWMVPA